jgi:FkbM family methyltransferase
VADALVRTIAENSFTARVTVHRIALDDRPGSVQLRHAPVTINQGAAYLAPTGTPPPGHVDVSVPALTLDDVVGAGPCAFVKLDAEGAEPRILAGAESTLRRCRPVLLAELNPLLLERVGGKRSDDVIAMMGANGYATRLLCGPSAGERIERYGGAASINVVFLPSD